MVTVIDFTQTEHLKKCSVCLGFFDGVHKGHQSLLQLMCAKASYKKVVFTFSNHPLSIICPAKIPKQLTVFEEKISLLKTYDIDLIAWTPFDKQLQKMDAQSFATNILTEKLHASELFVGENYKFGCGGHGNAEALETMGFSVMVPPPRTSQGTVISSTAIREFIEKGELEHAAKLLGYPFFVLSYRKAKNGNSYTVPQDKMMPPDGAYRCMVGREEMRIEIRNRSMLPENKDINEKIIFLEKM